MCAVKPTAAECLGAASDRDKATTVDGARLNRDRKPDPKQPAIGADELSALDEALKNGNRLVDVGDAWLGSARLYRG